jgi:thymidylate kinase
MKQEPRIIAVEGFDGVGKTTLSKYVSDFFRYEYHKSPTGIFAEVRNEFDKQGVSFSERLPFYIGDCIRVSLLLSEFETQKFVLDRYYYSTIAYHEAKQQGLTNPLLSIFYGLKQPDLVLLVKTDFNVLNERINQRNLKSLNDELFLNEELYNKIYKLYEKYINIPCYIIDNNGLLEDSKEQINIILKNQTI